MTNNSKRKGLGDIKIKKLLRKPLTLFPEGKFTFWGFDRAAVLIAADPSRPLGLFNLIMGADVLQTEESH